MQFEFKSYYKVTLIGTSIFLAFYLVITMIYVIAFFKKHSIEDNKRPVKFLLEIATSCFIIHFLSAPLVHGIHLINEKENDKELDIELNEIIEKEEIEEKEREAKEQQEREEEEKRAEAQMVL